MYSCVPHVVIEGLLPSSIRLEIPKSAILTDHEGRLDQDVE
jgi:hypothetical protein